MDSAECLPLLKLKKRPSSTRSSNQANKSVLMISKAGLRCQSKSPPSTQRQVRKKPSACSKTGKRYFVSTKLMRHTEITEIMRAKLRSWLMQMLAKKRFMRQTYALAVAYLDLYFMMEADVVVQDFQNIGISCFVLAAKFIQSYRPDAMFCLSQWTKILEFQRTIYEALHYNIVPQTYFHFAENLVYAWDLFLAAKLNVMVAEDSQLQPLSKEHDSLQNQSSQVQELPKQLSLFRKVCTKDSEANGQPNWKYLQDEGTNHKLRAFYEKLDCMYMVLHSLEYSQCELVANLFFVESRMRNFNMPASQDVSIFYCGDAYQKFFTSFLASLDWTQCELNRETGRYVCFFWDFTSQGTGPDYFKWEKGRKFEKLQSFTEITYRYCKELIERLRTQRL